MGKIEEGLLDVEMGERGREVVEQRERTMFVRFEMRSFRGVDVENLRAKWE